MVAYRPGSDVDLSWKHGETAFRNIGLQAVWTQAVLRRGYSTPLHRRPGHGSAPPQLMLEFRLETQGAAQMAQSLSAVPHRLEQTREQAHRLHIDGAYNIRRALSALFGEQTNRQGKGRAEAFIPADLHDALRQELAGFMLTQRYYAPAIR